MVIAQLKIKRSHDHKATRWLKRVALGAAAVSVAAAFAYAWMPKPASVDTSRVTRAPLEVYVEEDGRTRVRERFVVAAPIGGRLARVEVEPGDKVERGRVLARVSPPDAALLDARSRSETQARLEGARARVLQSEAALARARAAAEMSEKQRARARALKAERAISDVELEQRELEARLAAQDLAAAELAQKVAEADVAGLRAVLAPGKSGVGKEAEVIAPSAGIVLRVLRESEGPIAAGAPLIELGDPAELEVVVDVLSEDAAQIEPGAPAEITEWGGAGVLNGSVRRIEPAAFTHVSALGIEESRVNVIVALAEAPPALGDSFRVTARILLHANKDAIQVPRSAVFRYRDQWAVFVVKNAKIERRFVELGQRARLSVEVTSGLKSGEEVVIYPDEKLKDGDRARVTAS